MRNSKELAKSSERKSAVVSKKGAKSAPVRVVDVKLAAKPKDAKVAAKRSVASPTKVQPKKPAALAAARSAAMVARSAVASKHSAKKSAPAKEATETKSSAAKPVSAKSVPAKEAPRASVRAKMEAPKAPIKNIPKVVEEAPKNALVPPAILTPSAEILRPFRDAAKKNKQLARELEKQRGNRASFLAKPVKKGKKYAIDLRVHSPGTVGYFSAGGIDPGPALIRLANVKGLDMIALTDFYNAAHIDVVRNSPSVSNLKNGPLTILPAFDICCHVGTCKEVYAIVLFPEETSSATLFDVISRLGVPRTAIGRKDFVLSLPFEEILAIVEQNGGILIPSRVDKTPYRQLAIPELVERYGIHAFDLAHPDSPEFFWERWPKGGFTFFHFSNANALGQIGSRCGKVKLSQPGFPGIKELVTRRHEGAAPEAIEAEAEAESE